MSLPGNRAAERRRLDAAAIHDLAAVVSSHRRLVEVAAVSLLVALLTLVLTQVKLGALNQQFGDTTVFLQVVENLATRGEPVSGVFASAHQYSVLHVPTSTGPQLAVSSLAAPVPRELNYLVYHANYVLYGLGALTKVIPSEVVLMAAYAASFTVLLWLAYFALRAQQVSIPASLLFCLLIVSHPAWSQGLEWQFYPERLFVAAGFWFMALCGRNGRFRRLLVAGVLCLLIGERAATTAGIFLGTHTLLYWRTVTEKRWRLILAAALSIIGIGVFRFAAHGNDYYSTFLPHNFADLVYRFQLHTFVVDLALFMLVNGVFLIIALFEWRAAVLALVAMMPNIVGWLGGGEKVGWSTHYHDLYLPAVIWAASAGYAAAYRRIRSRLVMPMFYAGAVAAITFVGSIDPNATDPIRISLANLSDHFVPRLIRQADVRFGPQGAELQALYAQIERAVPEGTSVTVPEGSTALLHHNRTVDMFPINLDHADYAILSVLGTENGRPVLGGGVFSYLDAKEQPQIRAAILARMRRDGYDLDHPVIVVPAFSVAVVKRR